MADENEEEINYGRLVDEEMESMFPNNPRPNREGPAPIMRNLSHINLSNRQPESALNLDFQRPDQDFISPNQVLDSNEDGDWDDYHEDLTAEDNYGDPHEFRQRVRASADQIAPRFADGVVVKSLKYPSDTFTVLSSNYYSYATPYPNYTYKLESNRDGIVLDDEPEILIRPQSYGIPPKRSLIQTILLIINDYQVIPNSHQLVKEEDRANFKIVNAYVGETTTNSVLVKINHNRIIFEIENSQGFIIRSYRFPLPYRINDFFEEEVQERHAMMWKETLEGENDIP